MTRKLETKFMPIDLSVDADSGVEGTISGYASKFGIVDSYGDIVQAGAFKRSLSTRGLPAMLLDHDTREVVGIWDEVKEDGAGLSVRGRLNLQTQRGREVHSNLKMGALKGLSIGYRTIRARDVGAYRHLEDVELLEVSIVAVPALVEASVESIKSAERTEDAGPISTETTPAIAATHPIEEEISMTLDEIKAAMREAVASGATTAEITELKSKLAAAEAKLAEVDELKARLAEVETKAAQRSVAPAPVAPQVDETKAAFINYLRNPERGLEGKAFAKDTTSGGQYAVPATLAAGLGTIAQDASVIASKVGKRAATADKYEENLELADGNYEWLGDTDPRNITNNPTIQTVEAAFGEVSALVEVSRQSATDVNFDLEGYVNRSANRSFTKAIAAAILNGDGVKKPKGLFAAGTAVVTTEVAAFTYDAIVDLVFSTKADYRKGFTMSSLTQAVLAKLKDEVGRPLYQPSMVAGVPGTLLGYPVTIDEAIVGIIFGDLEAAYIVVDVNSDKGMHVLVDPYTRKGFIRYYFYKRIGGCVRDAAAIKRLVLED